MGFGGTDPGGVWAHPWPFSSLSWIPGRAEPSVSPTHLENVSRSDRGMWPLKAPACEQANPRGCGVGGVASPFQASTPNTEGHL